MSLRPVPDRRDTETLGALLAQVGLVGLPQAVYLGLLVCGPGTLQTLLKRTRAAPEDLEGALTLLQTLFLVQRQDYGEKFRFYATHPKIAWRWRELDAVWAGGLTLSSVELSPPLLDVDAERRRRLMPQLRDAAMAAYQPAYHTSVTIPRGRAYPDDHEFAYACAEAIVLAETSIVALQKPPMLPHLSLFWSAILDRRAAGVAYTRCVTLEEVLVHGCAIVSRDMHEVGVDLRFLPANGIRHRLYLVDDRILLFRNAAGQGRLVHRPDIVQKHRRRIEAALAVAAPGREVVAQVRAWADGRAAEVERRLDAAAAAMFRRICEGGRFTEVAKDELSTVRALASAGFVMATASGGYSAIAPTEGFLASLR